MFQAIVFPPKYIQGQGALKEIGHYVEQIGRRALLVGDEISFSLGADTICKSLSEHDVDCVKMLFGGECAHQEIARIAEQAKAENRDIIIGLGAGKVVDAARAASFQCDCKLAVVPTAVSSTAPISSSSAVYTEQHTFDVELEFPANPQLTLVDTDLIVTAPPAHLMAGIGDALAAWYEGEACDKSRAKVVDGGTRTHTISVLTKACKENLFTYGLEARRSCETKVVTPAFERVVEAILLMAGLSFEGPSCAAAHAIDTGMLNTFEELQSFKHGEIVAFTTLGEIVLGQYPADEVKSYVTLTNALGLPVCLKDFGIDAEADRDRLMIAAERACDRKIMSNEPFQATPELIYNAILAADTLGSYYGGRD